MSNNITQKFKSHLQAIGLKRLEKIFFALFLLSIPIQTRLTFYTPQTYLNENFNEYATFFLYLSDLFLITTLFIFFVNSIRKFIVSDVINKIFSYLARNECSDRHSKFSNGVNLIKKTDNLTKISNFSIKNCPIHSFPHLIPITFLLITLITWSFASILWSEYKILAFYQSIKFLEFSLLFLYIRHRLQWFGFNKFIALIFISGFFESLIGIAQYCLQKSLGLKILMESVLSPEIPNVAKIVIDGERIIRAYGTFPHPNVFSGFLILSIFCGIWLLFSYKTLKIYKIVLSAYAFVKQLFHVKQFDFWILNKPSFDKNNASADAHETNLSAFFIIGTITQITALIFTFSRVAWLASLLIIFIFVVLITGSKLFHACPPKLLRLKKGLTLNKINKLFHVKQFVNFVLSKTTIIFAVGIIIPLIIVIGNNWKQISGRTNNFENNYQQSIDNRVLYNSIAINIIKEYPLIGIGDKNFTLRMQEFTTESLEWWQFQPAHNIYLIIASELGIIGLALFLLFIFLVVKKQDLKQKNIKGFHPHPFLSKLFHVKQLLNYSLNKPKKLLNEKIMSNKRLSAIAFDAKEANYLKQKSQIVSRETISTGTQENETILAQTNKNEALLLQIGLISILDGYLFIGLFDHYFWTLQQGQLTFWIVLGAIAAINNIPTRK